VPGNEGVVALLYCAKNGLQLILMLLLLAFLRAKWVCVKAGASSSVGGPVCLG